MYGWIEITSGWAARRPRSWAESHENIHVSQQVVLTANRFQLELADQRQRGWIRVGILRELNRKFIRGQLLLVALLVNQPGARVDLVVVQVFPVPLDRLHRAGQALEIGKRLCVSVHQISILRDVIDELRPRFLERLVPRGLHRANELNQMHAFAIKVPYRFAERLHCFCCRIDSRGVEKNSIVVVANLSFIILQQIGSETVHLIELITPIVRQELTAVLHNRLRR